MAGGGTSRVRGQGAIVLRLLTALAAFSVLAGCATQAQIEAGKIVSTAREASDRTKACLSSTETKLQYARVYEKLGVAMAGDLTRMPSQAQMADPERISDDDIALGLRWYAETQECARTAIESFAAIDPELQTMYADSVRETTEIIDEIVTTKPTYGHVNQRLFSLKLHQKEAATQWAQNLRARLVEKHQQELEDRQQKVTAALNSLANSQVRLSRSQIRFAATHPNYALGNIIKALNCNTIARAIVCVLKTLPS
jgi:hypothetical protein